MRKPFDLSAIVACQQDNATRQQLIFDELLDEGSCLWIECGSGLIEE